MQGPLNSKLVGIIEFSKWPKRVPMKLLDDGKLSDIPFENYFWKYIEKLDIVHHVSRKGEKSPFFNIKESIAQYTKDKFLVAFNPIVESEHHQQVYLCIDECAFENVLSNLRILHEKYTNRLKRALLCSPKPWISLGSEIEISQDKLENRQEKISLECLFDPETRPQSLNFESYISETEIGGLIHINPEESSTINYHFELIAHYDVGVHVHTQEFEVGTQSDVILIDNIQNEEDFLSHRSSIFARNNCRESQKSMDSNKSSTPEVTSEMNQDQSSMKNDERQSKKSDSFETSSFNYYRSFINIEHRQHIISSVDWHPTKLGIFAVAYINNHKSDENWRNNDGNNKPVDLVCKKYPKIHKDDISINELIFNKGGGMKDTLLTKILTKNKSDDIDEEDEDEQTDTEEDDNVLKMNEKLSIYNKMTSKCYQAEQDLLTSQPDVLGNADIDLAEPEYSLESILKNFPQDFNCSHRQAVDQFCTTINLNLSTSVANSTLRNVTEESLDTNTSEYDIQGDEYDDDYEDDPDDSEITELSFQANLTSNVRICDDEDELSDTDVESIEAGIQIIDTEACVFIWHMDNELSPKAKLFNTHDINVIKFCPDGKNLIVGGSMNGQLVLWDLDNEAEIQRPCSNYNDITMNFLENIVGWKYEDHDYIVIKPSAKGDNNNSHLDEVTCITWLHPMLQIGLDGKLTKLDFQNEDNKDAMKRKQVLSSSIDGMVKVWNIELTHSSDSLKWSINLAFTIVVNNPYNEKSPSPIILFSVCISPAQYVLENNVGKTYKMVENLPATAQPIITIANNTGQVGVVRWNGKDDESVIEISKHEWWGPTVHDAEITSLSQHYFFPNILLSTGGGVFSLWNANYNGGSIWWHRYTKLTKETRVSLTVGCFSPYHPGLIYIAREDGKIDIWNLSKQIHTFVEQINGSGFPLSHINVITPPMDTLQIGVSDLDGNYHILRNIIDISWDVNDLLKVGSFFKQAGIASKQSQKWNKTWEDQCTTTDIYGFEHKPLTSRERLSNRRRSSSLAMNTATHVETESTMPSESPTNDKSENNLIDKLTQTEEYRRQLKDMEDKLKVLEDDDFYNKIKTRLQDIMKEEMLDDRSAEEIINSYIK